MEARRLFIRARRWPACPPAVYAAAALMEYRQGRDAGVARKIFEKGLENVAFLSDAPYVQQYADFLVDQGDLANARALFERVLADEAAARCRALWAAYSRFECEHGSVAAAAAVASRAAAALAAAAAASGSAAASPSGNGAGTGGGAGGAERDAPADALQLLLARYELRGVWPCTDEQRSHLEARLGVAAGPPSRRVGSGSRSGGFEGTVRVQVRLDRAGGIEQQSEAQRSPNLRAAWAAEQYEMQSCLNCRPVQTAEHSKLQASLTCRAF